MKKALKNKKGFTLVELMVVVAIIGVLVAVAVPVYNNVTAKAELSTIKANLRIINSSIQQYVMADAGYNATTATADTVKGALKDYLQEWPVGPNGTTYTVTKDSDTYLAVATLGSSYTDGKKADGKTDNTFAASDEVVLKGDQLSAAPSTGG